MEACINCGRASNSSSSCGGTNRARDECSRPSSGRARGSLNTALIQEMVAEISGLVAAAIKMMVQTAVAIIR